MEQAKAKDDAVVQLKPNVMIESGIALPRRRKRSSSMWEELPWLQMNVDDSFVFPGTKKQIASAMTFAKKEWPTRKHTFRSLPDQSAFGGRHD